MSLKRVAFLTLALLLVTTSGSSFNLHPPPPSLVGIWDFQVNVTRRVGRDGFVKKEAHYYDWVIRFRQDENKLTGDLLGGRGSRGENVCADAAIEGSIKGQRIEFVISYQGACCKDEQLRFEGSISEDNNITGTIEPVDVPRRYDCHLSYADIKGTKRETRR
jgi:hypothetical protein